MKPFFFHPILKTTLWGGSDIVHIKGAGSLFPHVGESWEISAVPGSESRVAAGEEEGRTLGELIERYGARLVGERNYRTYGHHFPLLVKFLSADRDLSIQVHPDDYMAHEMGHANGKTEMWYVVKARPGAMICSGFNRSVSPEAFTEALREGTICNLLRQHETHAGDCFFIPAGRIHSLGAGNFVIEVQQSSDDTFRVYDFNRYDADGRQRELHIDLARRALHYEAEDDYRTNYLPATNRPVTLVDSRPFTVRLHQHDRPIKLDYTDLDSFIIFVAFEGCARLTDSAGQVVELHAGESVLFPAENGTIEIVPNPSRPFGAIETFVK